VTLRATYSTAFRAPSIPELYQGRGPSAEAASDPCGGSTSPTNPAHITDPVLIAQCTNAPGQAGGIKAPNNGDDNVQINSNAGGFAGLQPRKRRRSRWASCWSLRWCAA